MSKERFYVALLIISILALSFNAYTLHNYLRNKLDFTSFKCPTSPNITQNQTIHSTHFNLETKSVTCMYHPPRNSFKPKL